MVYFVVVSRFVRPRGFLSVVTPHRGHYGAFRTHAKVWQSGFFWPNMYGDAKGVIWRCPRCQKHGNINSRDAMPLKSNLQVEIFDVWGVDFMGPFPMSEQCEYILVAVDYLSKCVEALLCVLADSRSTKRMFRKQYSRALEFHEL